MLNRYNYLKVKFLLVIYSIFVSFLHMTLLEQLSFSLQQPQLK